MLTFLLVYIITPILLLILALIKYARWHWGTLEKQGMPVIPPEHFLLGSAMLTYRKSGGLVDVENMKKYGDVYGYYEGREPQVFVCGAELIRKITTKDAKYFDARRILDFGDPLFNEFLDFQPTNKWKVLKTIFSAAVSSSLRLKNANPAMREAIYDFINGVKGRIKEKGKDRLEKFSMTDAILGLLIDLMARSQYSIDIRKSEANRRFVQLLRILTSPPGNELAWIATYAYAFPFLKRILPNTMVNPEPSREFCLLIKQMTELRRKERSAGQGPAHEDFLDSLVEWFDNLDSKEFKDNGITEMTVTGLGITLFIAGGDQFSLIISAMLKHISENPEIEKKIQEEVDQVFKKYNGIIDHEALSDLHYVTACVSEATRLYPFFYRAERVCTEDWEDFETGIEIKKGNTVQICLWGCNRNPKHFEDPEEFKPERFLPGNRENIHPYAFSSFGFGPRNCAGKRMSMEMMILITAHFIKELRFVKRPDSKISFVPAGPFFAACEPIYLDVELRS